MRTVHGGDIYTYQGMLDFSVNVNPLGPSGRVLRAAEEGVRHMEAYPDIRCRRLRARLAEKLDVPGSSLLFGNGAADLIYTLALAEKPKRALVAIPAFSEYEKALQASGCGIEYYETEKKDLFCITEEFPDRLDRGMDMLFLCAPSNPAGRAPERELLVRTAERCEELGIRFVLDECFMGFLPEEESVSLRKETSRFRNLFLLRSFTKLHAMPGLRLGYGISSDPDLVSRMEGASQPWSVSVPAQEAALAALEDDGRVERTRQLVREQRQRLENALAGLGIDYIPSQANYILLYSEYDLFREFAQRGILIRDCSDYRGLGKGWYRIAVRTEQENGRLLKALEEILKERPAGEAGERENTGGKERAEWPDRS